MNLPFPPAARLLAAAALLGLLPACLPGCNVIGTGIAFFGPSMTVPAVHEIPRKHTVAVIVDDYRGAATSPNLCAAIATTCVRHLRDDGKFKVVGSDQVQAAIAKLGDRWTGKKGQKAVSAASLGAALGADTIIYANVESSQVQLADNIYQPEVTLMVKAFTADGACVFPTSPDGDNLRQSGFALSTEIPHRSMSSSGRGAASLAEAKLASQAGMDLAHLFFAHQPQKQIDRLDNN